MTALDLRKFTGLTQHELGRIFGLPVHTKANGQKQCRAWQRWEQTGQHPALAGEVSVNLEQDLVGLVVLASTTGKTAMQILADALTFYYDRPDLVKCPDCQAPVFDLAFMTVYSGEIALTCPLCSREFSVRETANGYEVLSTPED